MAGHNEPFGFPFPDGLGKFAEFFYASEDGQYFFMETTPPFGWLKASAGALEQLESDLSL
jgi:hypothetical protein